MVLQQVAPVPADTAANRKADTAAKALEAMVAKALEAMVAKALAVDMVPQRAAAAILGDMHRLVAVDIVLARAVDMSRCLAATAAKALVADTADTVAVVAAAAVML